MLRGAMSLFTYPVRHALRTLPLLALLSVTGCPVTNRPPPDAGVDPELPRCPDSAPLALSLSCEPVQLEEACRPPVLQSGSLGSLATGLPEVDFVPLGDGLLVLQVNGDAALVGARYDLNAGPMGAPTVLVPGPIDVLAMRVFPVPEGFSVHLLQREAPGHFSLKQLRLDATGAPDAAGVHTMWEDHGFADAPVEVRWGVSADGETALAVWGVSIDGERIEELWGLETSTAAEPGPTTSPFTLATAEAPTAPHVRPGDVLGHPEGGFVVAGVESFDALGSIWLRRIPGGTELWRTPLEPGPEQPRLLGDPAATEAPRFALGWYSPGRIDNEVAYLRRAWNLGGDDAHEDTYVQYGAWYGVGGYGRVLQTLGVQEDRLLQISFEASLGYLPGTELGEIFLWDELYSYGPFKGNNLVPSWTGFTDFRVVQTPGDALVTAIPVVSSDGELSLSVFRMCL